MTNKCKQGFRFDKKKGGCVKDKKKGVSEDLNPTTERFFGLSRNKKTGLFIIVIGFLIWMFRPFQECAWYQIGCKSGSFFTAPIFIILSIIVIIVGVRRFIKKNG